MNHLFNVAWQDSGRTTGINATATYRPGPTSLSDSDEMNIVAIAEPNRRTNLVFWPVSCQPRDPQVATTRSVRVAPPWWAPLIAAAASGSSSSSSRGFIPQYNGSERPKSRDRTSLGAEWVARLGYFPVRRALLGPLHVRLPSTPLVLLVSIRPTHALWTLSTQLR